VRVVLSDLGNMVETFIKDLEVRVTIQFEQPDAPRLVDHRIHPKHLPHRTHHVSTITILRDCVIVCVCVCARAHVRDFFCVRALHAPLLFDSSAGCQGRARWRGRVGAQGSGRPTSKEQGTGRKMRAGCLLFTAEWNTLQVASLS